MSNHFTQNNHIERLKLRTHRCVCKFCGGNLSIRQIVFNNIAEARVEIFCERCNMIEYGVEPEIYRCARDFVENTGFNCLENMDDNERTQNMNIAKVCEIISWAYKDMGFLGAEGFSLPDKEQTKTGLDSLPTDDFDTSASNIFENNLRDSL